MDSLLRLFRAVEVSSYSKKKASDEITKMTIKLGFVFSPEVISNYSEDQLISMVSDIGNSIGITPEQLNSSFHKSWNKVAEASIDQLVIEQLVHYFTTYGFENLGIYDSNLVYIPTEELEIPEVVDGFNITVIRGYKKRDIKEKLLNLLRSGIALRDDTVKDVIYLCEYVGMGQDNVEDIKNKEVKTAILDHLDLIPRNPVEFLRYLIYKTTDSTLLIKNTATIDAIKESMCLKGDVAHELFIKYYCECGFEELSSIFLRYKCLFLAFKKYPKLKPMINKLKRLSTFHHEPMKPDYLNNVTSKIKNSITIKKPELIKHLNDVNVFRKIRLAYALKFRTKDVDSILYKIRNGRSYVSSFNFKNKGIASNTFDIVLESIINDIKGNVNGKKIYIPSNVHYALPATEKQFTGMIPTGSYISVSNDMVFGIYWEDVSNYRVDLDLSLLDVENGKIGWDSSYRSETNDILFSGDITSAPNGASELFYISKTNPGYRAMMVVNYFNFNSDKQVPFKIVVGKDPVSNFGRNYTVDPNNVIAVANTNLVERQKLLGLILTSPEDQRFYFVESSIGRSITSSEDDHMNMSRNYMFNYYTDTISLDELLSCAGATIVRDREGKFDTDLSPDMLEKDSIIKLLSS